MHNTCFPFSIYSLPDSVLVLQLYSLKISTLTKCEDYSQYKLLFPFPVFLFVSLREPLWFECVLTMTDIAMPTIISVDAWHWMPTPQEHDCSASTPAPANAQQVLENCIMVSILSIVQMSTIWCLSPPPLLFSDLAANWMPQIRSSPVDLIQQHQARRFVFPLQDLSFHYRIPQPILLGKPLNYLLKA